MKKTGLTGGIGSGKTMVCNVFAALGIPVYNADAVARHLMKSDDFIRQSLKDLLGNEAYQGTEPDRDRIAALVFKDPGLLAKVNRIVHPRVADHFLAWCGKQTHVPYIVHESALLFESDFYKLFDICITVTCPVDIRIQRLMLRQGMTAAKAESIIKNQLPEEEKISRSHYHVINDGDTLVLPQVLNIHAALVTPENN